MFYKVIRFLVAGIFRAVYRIHVTGADNIPSSGACIIAPNHTSAVDPIILGVIERRQIRFIGKAELFRFPPLGWLLKALGAFPVNRAEGDIAAVKKTVSILSDGELLCVFPQGTRCPGKPLRETVEHLKPGIGMMAMRSGAPVVPVYIRTKANCLCAFRRTDVIFGKPIGSDEIRAFDGRTRYADASAYIFERICELGGAEEKAA